MSSLLSVIRAVARDEIAARRSVELGTVTDVSTNSGGSGDHHLAICACAGVRSNCSASRSASVAPASPHSPASAISSWSDSSAATSTAPS